MSKLADLLLQNREWLADRVLSYARQHGFATQSGSQIRDWANSVNLLTEALVASMNRYGSTFTEFRPEAMDDDEPMWNLGAKMTLAHLKRGIRLTEFLGLFKYYRQAYLDLLIENDMGGGLGEKIIHRYFDRYELAACDSADCMAKNPDTDCFKDMGRQLAEEKSRLTTIFESLSSPVFVFDRGNQLTEMNGAGFKFTGIEHRTDGLFIDEDEVPLTLHELLPWLANVIQDFVYREEVTLRFDACTSDSTDSPDALWFDVSVTRTVGVSGAYIGVVIVLDDITERKHAAQRLSAEMEERRIAQDALREKSLWLSSTFNALDEGVFIVTPDRQLVDCNPAGERIFGYSRAELIGQTTECMHVDYASYSEFGQRMASSFELGETAHFEFTGKRKDGEIFPTEHSVSLMKSTDGRLLGILNVVRDITERKAMERELKKLATIDSLTGVFNRHRFLEKAAREVARTRRYGHPLTLLMVDIDHFKKVNDTYGHQSGDMVLRAVADTCKAALRGTDFIGRLGGEEFAIVLPETAPEQAVEVSTRLRNEVEGMTVETPEGPVRVTISAGVAWLEPKVSLAEMMHRADKALYEAKENGRNRVVLWEK